MGISFGWKWLVPINAPFEYELWTKQNVSFRELKSNSINLEYNSEPVSNFMPWMVQNVLLTVDSLIISDSAPISEHGMVPSF
jgi:hypothetical protein